MNSTAFPGIRWRADESTKDFALEGLRLDIGVAREMWMTPRQQEFLASFLLILFFDMKVTTAVHI
jgi:hypothetical protein